MPQNIFLKESALAENAANIVWKAVHLPRNAGQVGTKSRAFPANTIRITFIINGAERGGKELIDIEGYKNYLYEEELASNSVSAYCVALTQYAKQYDEITKPNLIEYKKELMLKYKPKSINIKIAALLKYCEYKDIHIKLKQVKEPKLTFFDNVISIEQYNKLVKGLEADGDLVWYINIVVLAKTGMRISEAVRVRKKDLKKGSVDMPTKAHMRTIYFPKSLIDDILPRLDELNDDDFILRGKYHKSITREGFRTALCNFSQKYDIPKEVMHPHSFRHLFALEFLKRNNNISLLADLLGHSNVNITQIYLRQSQEQQKDAIDKAVNW